MSRLITLNTGDEILVDECDWLFLVVLTWVRTRKHYFICRGCGYRDWRLHRLVAHRAGFDLSNQIDHRNGDRFDNTRANLRPATNGQNRANSRTNANNRSGYKGVHFKKGRWYAQINVNSQKLAIGYFDTPEAAHKAYMEAANKYFGEFANSGNTSERPCSCDVCDVYGQGVCDVDDPDFDPQEI